VSRQRWDELAVAMSTCTACGLSLSRQRVVPGQYPPGARVLLVGEAPGREEDEGGQPFVGRSGRLLDELLAEVGLDRGELAVVNTVKCRPPANRPPRRAEAATCRPWLEQQVEAVDPAVVVTLGGSALAWAFGTGHRLRDLRGRVHAGEADRALAGRSVVATYHPAAALRFGPAGEPRAALRADLALVAALLEAA
jgi:uracil-DNA glycosylase